MTLKNLFKFLCATYLFAIGTTRPSSLASILNISHYQILDWALSPLWKVAIYVFGHRGEVIMRGLEKHKRARREYRTSLRRFHAARLHKLKSEMLRQYGVGTNDLVRAERLWCRQKRGGLYG